ncbi:MAG: AMP-binding protein [Actinomycetota bacterium]
MGASVDIDRHTGLIAAGEPRPFPVGPSTFAEIWERRTPESVAVVDGDLAWTTVELRQEVERVARILTSRHVEARDRVAWVVGNDVTSIVSLLATVRVGAIWVGVSSRATEAEREQILADATPAVILDALPDGDPDIVLGPLPDGAAPAAIAYTSGTTGTPKGAVHTQQQLLYPAAAAIETEGLAENARIGTPLPLSTLNIVLLGPLTALACGGTAVIMRRADAAGFAEDLDRDRVTRALVVPTIVHDLVAAGRSAVDFASLQHLIMGGSGFDRTRAAAAQEALGVPLIASYGLSEAPTGVARMRVGEPGARALPGVDISVDAGGELSLAGHTSGPWAGCWRGTLGYWGRPDATATLWRDGRIRTGDAGTIDPDGRLLVTGRVGDMINRGGATIAPAEVEAVLLSVDGVEDAAVFGVPDERLGQAVAAAVVGTGDADRLRAAVRERLSGYKTPEHWLTVDALPRNANGKVDRDELRRRVGS